MKKHIESLNELRKREGLPTFPPVPRMFIDGWNAGYRDGGEHDCRMFEPSPEQAWTTHVLRHPDLLIPVPPPGHVCGLSGYNPMIDPPCPGCEHRRQAWDRERR